MVQSYKDVIFSNTTLNLSNYNKIHLALEDALVSISKRKEEAYKQDITKIKLKNKSNVVKIIEEIKLNEWRISKDIMEKLYELAK